jgi:hypothetical protein
MLHSFSRLVRLALLLLVCTPVPALAATAKPLLMLISIDGPKPEAVLGADRRGLYWYAGDVEVPTLWDAPANAVLERIDAIIGALRAAADQAASRRATICVVSDHGCARILHAPLTAAELPPLDLR